MDEFMQAAIDEAVTGKDEGGIPIGSVLVRDNTIIGRGHNRRVQRAIQLPMPRLTVWNAPVASVITAVQRCIRR